MDGADGGECLRWFLTGKAAVFLSQRSTSAADLRVRQTHTCWRGDFNLHNVSSSLQSKQTS